MVGDMVVVRLVGQKKGCWIALSKLLTLPTEIHWMLDYNDLDPINSTHLGLPCIMFYDVHKPIHGKVALQRFREGSPTYKCFGVREGPCLWAQRSWKAICEELLWEEYLRKEFQARKGGGEEKAERRDEGCCQRHFGGCLVLYRM